MTRLIMWNLRSLDGYFEGPEPWDLDWHNEVWGDELERFSLEQLASAATHPMAAAGTIEVRPIWDELAGTGPVAAP